MTFEKLQSDFTAESLVGLLTPSFHPYETCYCIFLNGGYKPMLKVLVYSEESSNAAGHYGITTIMSFQLGNIQWQMYCSITCAVYVTSK